jgi:hypothetical protein
MLARPLPISPAPLSGQPIGSYPVYLWYTESTIASSGNLLDPCSTSTNNFVREAPAAGVFLSDATARSQIPHAVCLGYLGWDGTSVREYNGPAASARQGAGVRAREIVAAEHTVLAHAEDDKPTVLSVQGALEAVASADGTPPVIRAPGGTITANDGAFGTLEASSVTVSEVRTAGGDLVLNPGAGKVPPFRLTAKGRLFNQTVAPPVDVTPLVAGDGGTSVLRLGALAIAFGTVSAAIDPPVQAPASIGFPVTFASAPAFVIAVCGQSATTMAAVATEVTATNASYRVTPAALVPAGGDDAAKPSTAALGATVSWIALGTVA